MKKYLFCAGFILLILSLTGCGNPEPVLSGISPDSKVQHMPSFELTVTGSDFVEESKIVFNNEEMTTTFVSSTELKCTIESDDITPASVQNSQGAGIANETEDYQVDVFVRTPSPGGGDSVKLPFTVKANHTFTTPKRITHHADTAECYVDLENNNINMLYSHWGNKRHGPYPVHFRRSTDGGDTWSTATKVNSEDHGFTCAYDIEALSGGKLLAVYEHWDTINFRSYFYKSESNNNGQTWSSPGSFFPPSINPIFITWRIFNENKIYYIYTIYDGKPIPEKGYKLKFMKRLNGVLGPEYTVTSGYLPLCVSMITDDSGNIYLFYMQGTKQGSFDIFRAVSMDNGQTWSTDQITHIASSWKTAWVPYVTKLSDNRIIMFWRETTITSIPGMLEAEESIDKFSKLKIRKALGELPGSENPAGAEVEKNYFMMSSDYGNTWGAKTELILNVNYDYSIGSVNVDSADNLNLRVYKIVDTVPKYYYDKYRIYYSRSIDLGQSWTTPVRICNGSSGGYFGRIMTLEDGNLYLIWSQHQNPNDDYAWDIMFSKTTD